MTQSRIGGLSSYWRVVAGAAVAAVVLMAGISAALLDTGYGNIAEFGFGVLTGLLFSLLFFVLTLACLLPLRQLPPLAAAGIVGALLALWYLRETGPAQLLITVLDSSDWSLALPADALSPLALGSLVLAIALVAGLVAVLRRPWFARLAAPARAMIMGATFVFLLIAVLVVLGLVGDGSDPFPDDGAVPDQLAAELMITDPGLRGNYPVVALTYGAGSNRRRPEFGSDRDLESRSVDARRLLPEWKDFKQDMRERYWGFGLDAAPLNGRIWAPDGAGPFPLVLIVHGNHGMEDYSDAGYAYLGELLASRGFITVSVDQNFINGSWSGDFRGREMAARGWLLLEHLALWRDWNATPGHRFAQRVDMQNIALIGHSRGGEAVSIAHRFNTLPRFPDDATVVFDYGFAIRSLVAIAQVDQRYDRRLHLDPVNFFTIHGSYDSDEPAYHGLRQMNRIALDGDSSTLKAGLYVHGANHGQFNSDWGRYDYSPPGAWRLNTAPIMPGEEQRRIARSYIAAFLEVTLHEQNRFLALLRDPRRGAAWLPPRSYVHQYTDSSFEPLADFEEDLDVSTASQPGARIRSSGLAIWREEQLRHRDQRLQGSHALVVGWRESGAQLEIEVPDAAGLSPGRALTLAVSGSLEKLPDEAAAADDPADGSEKDKNKDEGNTPAVVPDFSIEVADTRGNAVTVQASEFAQLIPPVRVRYLKNAARNREQYNADWEPVLQHVEIPLSALLAREPQLQLDALRFVRLHFDRSPEGVLILDRIGSIDALPRR